MKEIKKYTSIERYGKSGTADVIKPGDVISITEKVDGANASFVKDDDNFQGVTCYSRKQTLTPENTLQGFYSWVSKNIVPIKDKLNPNYRYIGEWTTPHKIKYKEEYVKTFLMFSIWDEGTQQYLSDGIVRAEAYRLGLETVKYFYHGEFVSYEHMTSFIGKSNITEVPNTGEGIVVKNTNYLDRFGKQVFVKLVSESFAEIQKQKLPKNPNVNQKELSVIKSIMTKARVDKLMHKLVDEELINREDFEIEKMGLLIKLITPRVIEDMYKEEKDMLSNIEESLVKKLVGKSIPIIIKEVLKDYGGM